MTELQELRVKRDDLVKRATAVEAALGRHGKNLLLLLSYV